MQYEKYLPIGTVVMLKNGEKKVMITGFCVVSGQDTTQMYDYSGCLYPEGIIKSNQTLMFNHNQIDKIYYIGLIDEDEKKFKKDLKELLKKIKEKNI